MCRQLLCPPPPANQHSCPSAHQQMGSIFPGPDGWTSGFPYHRGRVPFGGFHARGTFVPTVNQTPRAWTRNCPITRISKARAIRCHQHLFHIWKVFFLGPHEEYQGQIKRCFLIFSTSYFRPCIGEPSTSVVENRFFFSPPPCSLADRS